MPESIELHSIVVTVVDENCELDFELPPESLLGEANCRLSLSKLLLPLSRPIATTYERDSSDLAS